MKILFATLLVFALALTARAQLLFSDALDYPNGCIETDGVWFCYSPATPALNAFVTNDFLILTTNGNEDSVAAPFTNNSGNTLVFASFTINVSQLPSTNGSYFTEFIHASNNASVTDVSHIFIDTRNTAVPGTYRLGISDFATSITTAGATNFPLDLATGITYQVVFSYDPTQNDPYTGATLWINPLSINDFNVYANDSSGSTAQENIGTNINAIAFSPYANAAVGDVLVGLNFTDVMTNVATAPVIGIQPQSSTNYQYNSVQLYVAASGMGQLTYQWLSNNVAFSDDGVNVIGSSSNVLTLNNLQSTAVYSVDVIDTAGTTVSSNATNTVITTPTLPFFTVQPQNQTNSLFTTASLNALANGTGPLTYQWYFEATNASIFTLLNGQTSNTLSLPNLGYTNYGLYYVTATGGAGSANSSTSAVVVIPPLTVSIAQLHSLMVVSNSSSYAIGLGQYVTVSGRVTTFGPLTASTKTYAQYYIQDGTGGLYVYLGGYGTNAVPAPGSYVTITGPCQVYSGQLEIDPAVGTVVNGVTNGVIVSNAPPLMPAVQEPSFALMATNPLSSAGIQIQCALVTFTNIYIYGSKTGGTIGNGGIFYSNGYTSLYITQGPYSSSSNTNYMELFVPAYGFTGSTSTNLWGKTVPTHVYQITGVMANYNGASELDATRYDDFVSATPAVFPASVEVTNGVPTVTWPASSGSTYSVYSATNLFGPWTQTFGLGYYPSVGAYTDTNAAAVKFYRVSTP